jgi:competence CoiA-like predicted nuclease
MEFERTIKVAFDKISGEVLEANEIFNTAKSSFEMRKQFHKDEVELYCCECTQKLDVSGSKNDRLHFKHQKNANNCLLKNSKFSPKEIEELTKIYKSKESDRHKELKKKIAEKLSKITGVNSISVDDKFIINDNEKRKPDVFCKYEDKQLVFEIQLSDLSLRYIISRYEFYKRNGMYLIWILDNFDVQGQNQTEKDIKYLTEHHNFLKLDEKTVDFRLLCTYKYPFLIDNNKLLTKWIEKSISLSQLKFDKNLFQVYYFDFGKKLELKEKERLINIEKEKKEETERKKVIKLNNAEEKAKEIIDYLRHLWETESFNFKLIRDRIYELNEFDLGILNKSKAFEDEENEPKIHKWFSIAKRNNYPFLVFMLGCHYLEIDVNKKSKEQKSLFQTLFENKKLEQGKYLSILILKRGYIFTKEDERIIENWCTTEKEKQSEKLLYHLSNKLNNKHLIDKLFEHRNLICTIESAKRNQIIGFGYKSNQWIAFANNAIHSYKEYWDYIEIAFKHYGIWDKLIELDKKGTFNKKLTIFYNERPKAKFDCDLLFKILYPELNNENDIF